MNVVLCGYNWAGCRALDLLLEIGCKVFVCTHKTPAHVPSLFEYAMSKKINATYESVNNIKFPFKVDFICSIYYREIIRIKILEYVNFNAMNLHPSLLPSYRGCSSLTWAMINDEMKTGFSYHYIDEGCDTGKIILQKEISIYPFENQNNLYQRVMFVALENFIDAFTLMVDGFKGIEQKGHPTTYSRGAPEGGEIDPTWDESKIKRFIKAMINPPLPYAKFNGKEIKSYEDYLVAVYENRD